MKKQTSNLDCRCTPTTRCSGGAGELPFRAHGRMALGGRAAKPARRLLCGRGCRNRRAVGYIGMHHSRRGLDCKHRGASGYRRRGIATALLREAINYAENHDITRLTLEVRASNRVAIALYESLGFEKEGVRPDFYDSPKEDAAIYSLYIK